MDLANANKISLKDKQLFDRFFQKYPPQNSEFTFTNLFMWRNYYNFLFFEYKDHLLLFSYDYLKKRREPIHSDSRDYIYFFPPIGPHPDQIILEIFEQVDGAEIHRVPYKICENLKTTKKFTKLKLAYTDDRNNWDYVYDRDEILNLAGNKYRQNRRWLQKFLNSYNYEFQILTQDLIMKCKELQLEWCEIRACTEDESLEAEQEAIYEALDNFTALGFSGGILCVDEKCAAYTFGEILNEETLVIHIEKAHLEFEGAYQAINNMFLSNCCKEVVYVNREQDLGIDGLRRAKESYKPIRMVKKSIIFQKNQ
jgi:hypothetical protein